MESEGDVVDRARAEDARRRLEAFRLSMLAEIQWQRRSLDRVRQLAVALERNGGDGLGALPVAIRDQAAEALTSSRHMEAWLVDADVTIRELQAVFATPPR